jgi:hypothetical protein
MIRKVIGLLFALGLVGASAYILYLQAFHSRVIDSQYLVGGFVFGFLGLAWLWVDYIGPLLGFKEGDDDA